MATDPRDSLSGPVWGRGGSLEWQRAWDTYFANHPEVRASWGHQNGRWPHCNCESCTASPFVASDPQKPEQRWVRTNKRVGGLDDTTRRPGPWHQMHDDYLTWCGKRPQRLLSSQEHHGEQPEGHLCTTCVRQVAKGRPKPWRR